MPAYFVWKLRRCRQELVDRRWIGGVDVRQLLEDVRQIFERIKALFFAVST
jgi:hypothetical protein